MTVSATDDGLSEVARTGLALLQLGTGFGHWVTRRTEGLEILDYAVARRTVQVEVNPAAFPERRPLVGGMLAVPIALLGEELVLDDLRDRRCRSTSCAAQRGRGAHAADRGLAVRDRAVAARA